MSISSARSTEAIREAHALTERLLAEIRRLIFDLRPSVLDDLGLLPALRRYIRELSQRGGPAIELQATGPVRRLSPQIETALFRIVQEALTNVTKHAQARKATMGLEFSDSLARVWVQDDGKGFNPQEVMKGADGGRGLGLLGMQERAALLGGTLAVASQPGQGTRITVEVPLTKRGT